MKKIFNKKVLINLLAFIIPVIIILSYVLYKSIVTKGNFFHNGEVFLVGDASSQYNALYSYMHNVLIGKDSIFYSFYNSLGGNMSSTIGYYLGSPLNILYMFVSKINIPFMTFIIYIIKISLCSLFMNILLNYKYDNKYSNLIFSVSYAFMGYTVVYYFNSMWLDVIYMTPLVIMGLEKLIKGKPITYVVTLSLSIIFNFYIAYMLCIFTFLYFMYKSFSKYEIKEFKKYKKILLDYILYSLLSVGISCFFLLPVLFNLSEIIRAPLDSSLFGIKAHNFSNILNLLVSKTFIGSNNTTSMFGRNRPVLYISLYCLILSILYFFNKNIKLKERLLSLGIIVFFILSFIFPYLQLFWQGFTFPNGYIDRFSYLYAFFLILLASKEFYSNEKLRISKLVIFYAVYLILSYFTNKEYLTFLNIENIIISIIFITIYLILLFFKTRKNKFLNLLIIIVVVVELLTNYYMSFVTARTMKIEPTYSNFYNRVCNINHVKDDNIYRVDGNFTYTLLDSFVCDYHNMTSGLSTINGNLYKFLKNNGESITYTTIFYDYDKPTIMESLLGIKYTITTKELKDDNYNLLKSYTINLSNNKKDLYYDIYLYENKNALNLGYKIYNSNIKTNNESLNNLNKLIKFLSGIDENVLKKIDLKEIDEDTYEFYVKDVDKKYYLSTNYNISTNYSIYGELYLNEVAIASLKSDTVGSVKLSSLNIGKNVLKIKDKSNINNISVYYLDEDVYQKMINKLKKNMVNNIELDGNTFKGNILIDEDSTIFLSIPYDTGWNIYIDGKKTKYKKIANGFIGIDVPSGDHKIYMKYYPKGIKLGSIISLISIILFVILVRLKRKLEY